MHISIVVTFFNFIIGLNFMNFIINETKMWANAQRDGHPAEYRWRLLFNDAKFG